MSRSYHVKSYSLLSAEEKIRQYLEALADQQRIGLRLNEEQGDHLIKQLQKLRKNLEATYRRRGTSLVTANGECLIMAYHVGSYDNQRLSNSLKSAIWSPDTSTVENRQYSYY